MKDQVWMKFVNDKKGGDKKHLRILPDDPDAFEKKKYFLTHTREEFFEQYPDHKES
ncbi:hypothetical protein HC766_03380 [Candidatus Gracilibacteria bacterium]|nr:hypothetical protein [Candidatus Gracilibacteria bacterium]